MTEHTCPNLIKVERIAALVLEGALTIDEGRAIIEGGSDN